MNNKGLFSWRVIILVAAVMGLGASCKHGVKSDSAMASLGVRDAQQTGDATVIIEGTSPPPVGFHYIRMQQGQAAQGSVFLQVPPAECRPAGSSCVNWDIFRPDGTEFGNTVPFKQTRVAIPFKQLFNSDTVELGSRGPFGVLLTVRWVDVDGRDRVSKAEGEIYVRVVRNGYQSLNATPDSPEYVWTWSEGTKIFRMTAGLRAYAGLR